MKGLDSTGSLPRTHAATAAPTTAGAASTAGTMRGWRINPMAVCFAIFMAGMLLLAGCDPQRVAKLEEGVSTEVDVRKQFGDPVTVTVAPDGTRTLDYPRQPEGWTNYVIKIGPDGKMSSLRQLLNEDNFARIRPGMSQQQVRDALGRPAEQKKYALKNEEVWSWRYKPVNESKLFTVTFDAESKVATTAKADDPREQAQAGR